MKITNNLITEKITAILFSYVIFFQFSCVPKIDSADETLKLKWSALQHKFYHLEHHGYEPNLLTRDQWSSLFIFSICDSEEWVDLVNFLKDNPNAQLKLLGIFESSKATYEDLYFKLVHMIPCLLYASKGGNLKGLASQRYGVEFGNAKTLEILLSDEVKCTDYEFIPWESGPIDYGTPIEMHPLLR